MYQLLSRIYFALQRTCNSTLAIPVEISAFQALFGTDFSRASVGIYFNYDIGQDIYIFESRFESAKKKTADAGMLKRSLGTYELPTDKKMRKRRKCQAFIWANYRKNEALRVRNALLPNAVSQKSLEYFEINACIKIQRFECNTVAFEDQQQQVTALLV